MAELTVMQAVTGSAVLGVLSHLLYFKHGEHNRHGIYFLATAVSFPWLLSAALHRYYGFSIISAIGSSLAVEWSFIIALFSSMLIYRVYFHPLNNFPGPFMAKTSKFWHSSVASKMHWYKDVNALHAQYGDYVRTGPNEISIADPESIQLIHGPRTRCIKAAWYDMAYPQTNLQFTRSLALHNKRRKVAWERAFTAKALRGYDDTVIHHADELVEGIAKFEGKPVNVSKWYNFFTADTMSALGFGAPFNMLRDAKDHWTIEILQEGSSHLAALGPVPWVLTILMWFPFLAKANFRARDWCIAQIEERKKREVEDGKDIMAWMLDPLEKMESNPKKEFDWLVADARLAIIAGTDTSTAALSFISYRLASDPQITQNIRKELIKYGLNTEFSIQELQHCEYLQSIIDESMRLNPPVPDGVYRMTPPEGLQIGETFIPGGVTIINPTYTVHRSAKAFERPDEFIPERWTTKPELVKDKRAFTPFSVGTYSCVGKQLALNEIRTVLAKLILSFDIAFAPGEDGKKLLEETEDFFVLKLGEFNLSFTPVKA